MFWIIEHPTRGVMMTGPTLGNPMGRWSVNRARPEGLLFTNRDKALEMLNSLPPRIRTSAYLVKHQPSPWERDS